MLMGFMTKKGMVTGDFSRLISSIISGFVLTCQTWLNDFSKPTVNNTLLI